MTTALGYNNKFMLFIDNLYRKYHNTITEIRNKMAYTKYELSHNIFPMFDDIEAEIVCMLLLESNPKKIIEFSPCTGWSTLYMLNTIIIGNLQSYVYSFDIVDKCINNINMYSDLSKRWLFHLDDVNNHYKNFLDVDYLFIDSDHSKEFTLKYIDNLLEPLLIYLKQNNKYIYVSVHDVFHSEIPSEEGLEVIKFLEKYNIGYFAPANKDHYKELLNIRNIYQFGSDIHYSTLNTAIFFLLG